MVATRATARRRRPGGLAAIVGNTGDGGGAATRAALWGWVGAGPGRAGGSLGRAPDAPRADALPAGDVRPRQRAFADRRSSPMNWE